MQSVPLGTFRQVAQDKIHQCECYIRNAESFLEREEPRLETRPSHKRQQRIIHFKRVIARSIKNIAMWEQTIADLDSLS